MQTLDRRGRRASALAFSVSILAVLAACSSSESDSSNSAVSTTNSSGGNGTSDTGGTSDTHGTSGGGTTGSVQTRSSGGTATGSTVSSTAQGSGGSAGMASGGAAGADPGCSVDVASHDLDAAIHVIECSPIAYSTNPPASGEHYPVWAAYQTYDFPVPRGYWVHSLEHGAVVFTYNCPDGCPDEVAQVESIIASLSVDPRCVPYDLDRQVILTPDPLLDTRWAMSSWGHTLRADCIDEAAFRDFYEANVAHGPEDICGGGNVLTEATLAPNCGE